MLSRLATCSGDRPNLTRVSDPLCDTRLTPQGDLPSMTPPMAAAGEKQHLLARAQVDRPDLEDHANGQPRSTPVRAVLAHLYRFVLLSCLIYVWVYSVSDLFDAARAHVQHGRQHAANRYGSFPKAGDPFHFVPCSPSSLPLPALSDPHPTKTWKKQFDPNVKHWSWGKPAAGSLQSHSHGHGRKSEDPNAGRGIFLCGWLDVPLDYNNSSATADGHSFFRLAVTKYQVSGLAVERRSRSLASRLVGGRFENHHRQHRRGGAQPGEKSERTIVINPGGPGGSGTAFIWTRAEFFTEKFSEGTMDVLGFDPRGVNATLPAISCFPSDALRDRWSLLTSQTRESAFASPDSHLELADAMADATLRACWQKYGADWPRYLSTALVARDVEAIREALGEQVLTAVMISYGTGLGQTYANMFPDKVGAMVLDGTEYVRDGRELGGFGWTALDNATDAWHDGFVGECIKAGPDHCALAQPRKSQFEPVTVEQLEARLKELYDSVLQRPVPGYLSSTGPGILTYSSLIAVTYSAMYAPGTWKSFAGMLSELEDGNATSLLGLFEKGFSYDPTAAPRGHRKALTLSSEELGTLVICSDAYDAPAQPLEWWTELWEKMTRKSWISGNSRFYDVLPCRHFSNYWTPAEVYRGDLNNTLRNPVLLIAETHDPATPLRNGRRLLAEMGANARLSEYIFSCSWMFPLVRALTGPASLQSRTTATGTRR